MQSVQGRWGWLALASVLSVPAPQTTLGQVRFLHQSPGWRDLDYAGLISHPAHCRGPRPCASNPSSSSLR